MQLDRQTVKEQLRWNGTAVVVGAVVGGAVERALASRWRKLRGRKPPEPADRSRSLVEAVVWRAVAGATVGVVTAFTRRSAAVVWERVTGDPPPGVATAGAEPVNVA
jgi:hypothetical protein